MNLYDFKEDIDKIVEDLNKEIQEYINLDIDFTSFLKKSLRLDTLMEMKDKRYNLFYDVLASQIFLFFIEMSGQPEDIVESIRKYGCVK